MRNGIAESIYRTQTIKTEIARRMSDKSLVAKDCGVVALALADALLQTLNAIAAIDRAPQIHGYDMTYRPYRGVCLSAIDTEVSRIARSLHLPKFAPTQTAVLHETQADG